MNEQTTDQLTLTLLGPSIETQVSSGEPTVEYSVGSVETKIRVLAATEEGGPGGKYRIVSKWRGEIKRVDGVIKLPFGGERTATKEIKLHGNNYEITLKGSED